MGKVVVIGGPTASGKSALAYELALEKKGIVLNGDSLQVYQGLEILTDQPSLQIQQAIPHRLYGFLEPTQPYSAGIWLSQVLKEIEESHQKGQLPIVVGGTGLYLKTLLQGITPIPFIDPSVREYLQTRDCGTQEILYNELQVRDPDLATRIHPHDYQRTLRGLEVYYGTGIPLSEWQAKKPTPLPYEFEKILVMPSKEDLGQKIKERIEKMVTKGVLEEIAAVLPLPPAIKLNAVRPERRCAAPKSKGEVIESSFDSAPSLSSGPTLRTNGGVNETLNLMAVPLPPSPTAMKAIGLREFGAFIKGECSLEQAKELTFIHTCQYAKRQRTWFRHQFKG